MSGLSRSARVQRATRIRWLDTIRGAEFGRERMDTRHTVTQRPTPKTNETVSETAAVTHTPRDPRLGQWPSGRSGAGIGGGALPFAMAGTVCNSGRGEHCGIVRR